MRSSLTRRRTRVAAAALAVAIGLALSGCGDEAQSDAETTDSTNCRASDDRVTPVHSKLWDISYHDTYKVLTVPNTEFRDRPDLHYVLVQCGAPTPELDGELADAPVFEVPVDRTALNHNNALGMLEQVGVTDTIVGMSDEMLSYRDDPWYSAIIESANDPENLGGGDGVDYETTLGVKSDVLFMAGYGPGYTNVSDQVERGLPAVMVANRLEPTPLGSAEWMKFVATFFNAEATANRAFGKIERAYTGVAERIDGVLADDYEAAYLCIEPENGCEFIYAHGGETLNGRILEMLGATNPFADGNRAGNGMNFDFEQSLARATDADFFVVYELPDAVDKVLAGDDRMENFQPFVDGNYVTYRDETYAYCRANLYVRVDILIRDYAIGMAPERFPDADGKCFARS